LRIKQHNVKREFKVGKLVKKFKGKKKESEGEESHCFTRHYGNKVEEKKNEKEKNKVEE
ncbi:uncharacterized protein LOC121879049, partial [Homarus americanus]|uniref:uncharacterized protein LOC121879049 n=1 Tax=Homarus americanus TaxID=6706 RepID=UPI001C471993